MVCVLSLVCTIVRETFNDWTPVYMRDFVHLSMSDAAGMSAIFPGVGAISVLVTGWLGDRLGRQWPTADPVRRHELRLPSRSFF